MGWLTKEEVLPDGHQKVRDLTLFIASRTYKDPLESNHDDVARAVRGMQTAAVMMRREWFFASIGVMDVLGEDGEETYYLARSPDSYFFSTHNIVPWTNWLGSVYAAVSEALRRRVYPKRLTYGPEKLRRERDVGPLVNYRFDQGVLTDADFYSFGTAVERPAAETLAPEGEFGLRDIVTTIDTDQDSKLRASMSGTFILTGGPGVGKTTVALHRLAYLINEQNAEGKKTTDHYAGRANLFFTPETMAVVVWKDHLVPYLDSCLKDLGLERVRVQHIEDWVAEALRSHVPFGLGRGQFQLYADPTEITDAKLCCNEADIKEFLLSEHSLLDDLRERYAELHGNVNQWLAAAGFPTTKQVPTAQFTVDDVEASFASLTNPVDKAVGKLDHEVESYKRYPVLALPVAPTEDDRRRERDELIKRSQRRNTREEGIALSRRLSARLTQEKGRVRSSAVRLLRLFYDSPECSTAVSKHSGPVDYVQLLTHVREQKKASRLSLADRYLILWTIKILGKYDSSAVNDKASPPKEYSHVVVDEAQYYHPLLLRLLHAVTKEPRKSMTIVGDLEQRISSDGGLVTWEAAGIVVPKENVQRLDTNYRWSKQVFGFLSQFRKAAGLRDSLREPDVWYSKEGVRPDVVNCRTRDQEYDALAQRINQIKTSEESKRWSIAVVLPFDERHDAVQGFIELFRRCDVRARWASGQDLRESKDHVVLTTYDSVVGLEFDAVMLPGVDLVLRRSQKEDALRALWVAVTRARKYEWLSGLEGDTHWAKLFGKSEFNPYRSAAEAFLT